MIGQQWLSTVVILHSKQKLGILQFYTLRMSLSSNKCSHS